MYRILTSKKNEHKIATVLLYNEEDYLSYIKDNNFIEEEDFKDILFGKPSHYPAILVTHFDISMSKFINHKVYGEYIYLSSFAITEEDNPYKLENNCERK